MNSTVMWAVSQATFMRRMHITGLLYLHDNNGWASGGFLSDSLIGGMVDSGSQQQWLSRNCNWNGWRGSNWNIVFAGIPKGILHTPPEITGCIMVVIASKPPGITV